MPETINNKIDIWITDPPYADAVNYHELTEFFLAWDKKFFERFFPEWSTRSKESWQFKVQVNHSIKA